LGSRDARMPSACTNARIRKSRSARPGSTRSSRSRNAAISSSRLRFSMKYSSVSSCALRNMDRLLRLHRSQHLDASDHDVAVDAVNIERLTDVLEQHDGEFAAQMFLKFGQTAQHVALIGVVSEISRQLRRVDRQAKSQKNIEHAPPFGFRQMTA